MFESLDWSRKDGFRASFNQVVSEPAFTARAGARRLDRLGAMYVLLDGWAGNGTLAPGGDGAVGRLDLPGSQLVESRRLGD